MSKSFENVIQSNLPVLSLLSADHLKWRPLFIVSLAIFVYFNNHDYLPNFTADTCFPEKKKFKNRF